MAFGKQQWAPEWATGLRTRFGQLSLGLLAFGVVLWLGWQSPAIANPARPYDQLEFPPLGDINIPDYSRYELDNGLVVYLMEDRELPLVSGTATFRTGDRLEPADKVGLAQITGSAMRLGGTETSSPTELNQALEQRAASIETSIDAASGTASFDVLSEDLEDVFALFADVLQRPAFDPAQVNLLRTQVQGGIARRNDSPDDIANREFTKRIYGETSPYARTVEYDTLAAIEQEDILGFYQASVRPEHMILGLVGDFDTDEMAQLVAQYFGDWQQAAAPALPEVAPVTQAESGVFFVDQPQLTQSYVQLGHLGGQLSDPDHAALSVMNGVLNGFGGRLFNEMRSRQGLAYVVYGFWSPRFDYPGLFIGGGQTRSETTVPFIQAWQTEVDKIRSAPVSAAELDYAKSSVLNSFVFNFQDPTQTLSRLIRYEYYGYPSDFVFQFRDQVEATTAEQVQAAAQRHLQPDNLVMLVVGNQEAITPALSNLTEAGDVTSLDITIAPPST